MRAIDRVGSKFLRCIIRQMKAMGLTHSELAKRMKISRPYVTKVLHGDVNITLATAARFAKALGMDFVAELRERKEVES